MTHMYDQPRRDSDAAPSEFDKAVDAIARSVMAVKEQNYRRALREVREQRAAELHEQGRDRTVRNE